MEDITMKGIMEELNDQFGKVREIRRDLYGMEKALIDRALEFSGGRMDFYPDATGNYAGHEVRNVVVSRSNMARLAEVINESLD